LRDGRSRRVAFLHLGRIHEETPALVAALEARGVAAELVPLESEAAVAWERFDLVSVRDCRGSHLHADFLPRILALADRLERLGVPLRNPAAVIQAGQAKSDYLPPLERAGVALIPTRWLPRGWQGSLAGLLEDCGWPEAVIKPAIGSRSWQTFRVRRGPGGLEILPAEGPAPGGAGSGDDLLQRLSRESEVCVQRFLPSILEAGEFSAVFIDGDFSHAVRKRVAAGAWIAHEHFGGRNLACRASTAERQWADGVHTLLQRRFGSLLYSRIDGIRDAQGELRLLECELVIPRLFLQQGKAFGRYADALVRHLSGL